MREELKIGEPIICVYDKEAEKKGELSSFLRRIRALGFKHLQDPKGSGVPYIFINLTSRVYVHGVYGVKYAPTIADSKPISVEDFDELVRILDIKSPEEMQKEKEEREEEERKRLEKIRNTTLEEYKKMVWDALLEIYKDENCRESVEKYLKANEAYIESYYEWYLEDGSGARPNALAYCMFLEDNPGYCDEWMRQGE